MRKVIIASDSTCDLSDELLKKYDIKTVPLYINLGGISYHDKVDITVPEMYEKIGNSEGFPKTSATTPADFYEFFKPFIDDGYDIVYTGIGGKLSGTLQSAYIASQEFESGRIFLVDSCNLSTGIGLILMKAVKYRDSGMGASDIAKKIEDIVPRVRSQFVIDTLEYLHKGGRLSGSTALVATALRIKPMIKVVDGGMVVAKKTIGSLTRAIKVMVDEFIETFDKVDKDFVFITHSESHQNADFIRNRISKVSPQIGNLVETNAGCVISSHCGPGCIGILYIEEE
ncbi:MAG: DegV family protein [Bacilli bacterium]|nr:DegV family protein [Bacilli bacterium]